MIYIIVIFSVVLRNVLEAIWFLNGTIFILYMLHIIVVTS